MCSVVGTSNIAHSPTLDGRRWMNIMSHMLDTDDVDSDHDIRCEPLSYSREFMLYGQSL